MNEDNHDTRGHPPRHGQCRLSRPTRLGLAAGGLIAMGALIGALATAAVTVSAHGGFRHHGSAGMEEARDYAEFKVGRMLESVEATPEQSAQVRSIVVGLVENLHPLIEQHRGNRRALIEALTRAQIDGEALEALRQAEMELFAAGSAKLVNALTEAAEVLTPEQRRALIEQRRMRFRH